MSSQAPQVAGWNTDDQERAPKTVDGHVKPLNRKSFRIEFAVDDARHYVA